MSDLGGTANGALDESLLDSLRHRHKELQAEHRRTIPIQGYGGDLLARYRPPGWGESKTVLRDAAKSESTRADLNAYATELANACVGIYLKTGDGTLKQVAPGYGPELAELLGFEPTGTARGDLFATFGDPAPSDEEHEDNGAGIRVSAHHDVFLAWARGDIDDDEDVGAVGAVDEEFLGE